MNICQRIQKVWSRALYILKRKMNKTELLTINEWTWSDDCCVLKVHCYLQWADWTQLVHAVRKRGVLSRHLRCDSGAGADRSHGHQRSTAHSQEREVTKRQHQRRGSTETHLRLVVYIEELFRSNCTLPPRLCRVPPPLPTHKIVWCSATMLSPQLKGGSTIVAKNCFCYKKVLCICLYLNLSTIQKNYMSICNRNY